jgi:hypothetical protein
MEFLKDALDACMQPLSGAAATAEQGLALLLHRANLESAAALLTAWAGVRGGSRLLGPDVIKLLDLRLLAPEVLQPRAAALWLWGKQKAKTSELQRPTWSAWVLEGAEVWTPRIVARVLHSSSRALLDLWLAVWTVVEKVSVAHVLLPCPYAARRRTASSGLRHTARRWKTCLSCRAPSCARSRRAPAPPLRRTWRRAWR